jgi:hypothetical protein
VYSLAQFAYTGGYEANMNKLPATLLLVGREIMQPETAVLWLKKIERST